jgi:hypothetical protein
MKIITKKNFLPIVCMVYTLLSLGKLIFESANDFFDQNYPRNFASIFIITFLAVLLLLLHNYLQHVPIVLLFFVQYVLLLGVVLGSIYIESLLGVDFHENAYRDMFLSFSIPYVILVLIYYGWYFYKLKKANAILQEFSENQKGDAS